MMLNYFCEVYGIADDAKEQITRLMDMAYQEGKIDAGIERLSRKPYDHE